MPASRTTRMTMIAVSVRRALRTAGAAKAVTPLLTASTPVIAVQPLANARSNSQSVAPLVAGGTFGGGTTGTGWPSLASVLTTPMPRTANRQRTNAYVGA